MYNGDCQCDLPALEKGVTYTHIATGGGHAMLLRSNGEAVACGNNIHSQCMLPALKWGVKYSHVAAGGRHTLL